MAAEFLNESTSGQFKMTVDESTKTVSVTKISPTATAATLDTVMTAFDALFVAAPLAHYRQRKDLIDEA